MHVVADEEGRDHPLRGPLVDELHSRPFPVIGPDAEVHFVALRPDHRSARDREAEHRQLAALLDAHGAPCPEPGQSHWIGRLGEWHLKWESHTEFVTFLAWREPGGEPFCGDTPLAGPAIADGPGRVLAALRVHVGTAPPEDGIVTRLGEWFDPSSLAVSGVLEEELIVAGDFRIAEGGAMRFAVLPRAGTGRRRIGRVVQRVCEIETYRALAMFGLARSREMAPDLARIEGELRRISAEMAARSAAPAQTLDALLALAGQIEEMSARSSFRFSASAAYEALVAQRIAVLRETRVLGRQTFGEFMNRRFDPAMRTVASTEARLGRLSDRALRIGEFLRTRVEVERSSENKALLESMDRRSDQALKLQHTVEGLSVVAISYYATGLVLYVAAPFAERAGVAKGWAAAIVAPLVVGAAWIVLRRVRNRIGYRSRSS